MTNINVVENKISDVKKYLKILENYQSLSQSEIEDDITVKGAVERYLYLAVQSTIDLAEAAISFKNFRKPIIYSEAFEILSDEEIIKKDLSEKLKAMVGFRNIIAHDYAKIDFTIVYNILTKSLGDINAFSEEVKLKIVNA